MKKIKLSIQFYLLLTIFSIIAQSCCIEKYKIVGNGEMTAYVGFRNPMNIIDTVSGEFLISVQFDQETAGIDRHFGLITSAYAYTCEDVFENYLDESSVKLFCDKSFTFDGEVFEPGSDITAIEELEMALSKEFGNVEFYFFQIFLDKAIFQNGEHTFTVEAETTDGLKLTNQLTLTFDF
ncbi:MAG: hypothetical protein R2788_16470 [Saprospiraceae bacterium]